MDKGALTDVLEVVLTRVHAVSIATPEGHHVLTEIREGMINQDLAEEIVLPVLEMQPEFKDKAPMINSGAGLSGFQSQFVASMLVREARGRKSAKAAVAWLEKVSYLRGWLIDILEGVRQPPPKKPGNTSRKHHARDGCIYFAMQALSDDGPLSQSAAAAWVGEYINLSPEAIKTIYRKARNS